MKTVTGFRSYVSVDGGMPDNPRYALYGSAYTVYLANKMDEEKDFTCTGITCQLTALYRSTDCYTLIRIQSLGRLLAG